MEEAARAADFDFGGMAVAFELVGVLCFITERRACGTAALAHCAAHGVEGLGTWMGGNEEEEEEEEEEDEEEEEEELQPQTGSHVMRMLPMHRGPRGVQNGFVA